MELCPDGASFYLLYNQTVCKLLKQASKTVITAIKFQKAFSFSYILTPRRGACRVVDLYSIT